MNELYRKYRPQTFAEMIGQEHAVKILEAKIKGNDLPHVIMLSGPTGVGKTTTAQIIAREIGCTCTAANLIEIDVADDRSIDMVREVKDRIKYLPMGGNARVWIFDEAVQLPKLTQQAFLDQLERVPNHAYLIFCSSETTGMLPTFLGRMFPVKMYRLSDEHLREIMKVALAGEGATIPQRVGDTIIAKAGGSARRALQLLELILPTSGTAESISVLDGVSIDQEAKIEFLALSLLKGVRFDGLLPALEAVGNDTEGIRRQVLAYMNKVLTGNGNHPRASEIITAFSQPWYDSGAAGLANAVYKLSK